MAQDSSPQPAPPVRTLLHRDLPEPLPPRPVWPARVLLWMPVLAGTMIVMPMLSWLFYPQSNGEEENHLAALPITMALLAGLAAIGYELVALVRRRSRRQSR